MGYTPGRPVEIKPAYNMDTGERDIWDAVAGLAGHIVRCSATSDDVLVRFLDGSEDWVYCQRLKLR